MLFTWLSSQTMTITWITLPFLQILVEIKNLYIFAGVCFDFKKVPTQVLFFSRATSLSRRKYGFRRSQSWDPGWPHGRFLKDFLGVLESTDSRWANPIEFTGGKPWEVFPIIPQTLAIFSVYLVIENGGILNWFLHEIKIQIFQIKTVIFKNILTHGHWLKSVIKVARFWGVAPISDGHAREFFRLCAKGLIFLM